MTALSLPSRRLELPDLVRRAFVPAEGWLSLLFVMLMSLTVAWSVDDASWVLGRGRNTDFLAPMAVAGVLAGFSALAQRGRGLATLDAIGLAGGFDHHDLLPPLQTVERRLGQLE